jgi:LPXTG-motif cell wall-anchored protein
VPPGPQGTLPATGPAAATSAIAATAAALILIGLVARRLAR